MSQLSRITLSQSVTDALLTRIRSGQLNPGDRLPTASELMTEFGVGRNTIREAMQALVVMGLVEVRPRIGATVRAASGTTAANALALSALLDDAAVRDLYEFRRAIEVAAAGLAAERATADEIAEIGRVASRYVYDVEHGMHGYEDDLALHQVIAHASHNVYFVKVLSDVAGLLAAARRETERVPGAADRASVEHVAIFEAIRDRSPERARAAMATHIDSAIWAVDQVLGKAGPRAG
jgi:GntR family transcriptional repressor for pyruvate dehydrogenase complex